jgi:hypothetical protein
VNRIDVVDEQQRKDRLALLEKLDDIHVPTLKNLIQGSVKSGGKQGG